MKNPHTLVSVVCLIKSCGVMTTITEVNQVLILISIHVISLFDIEVDIASEHVIIITRSLTLLLLIVQSVACPGDTRG